VAVSIDDLVTPLPSDGSAIRDDLLALAALLGLPRSQGPGDPLYQLASFMGRWGTKFWNRYAIQAIRAQFGALASGDWLTLWMRSKGIDRPLATFATGPVTLENRSLVFVDLSAVGAAQITVNGNTYTSQGPAPGNIGTMGAAVGATYLQTTLIFEATVEGTAANVPAATIPGFPTTLASGPPGVYVATSSSTPSAPNGAILGSDQMSDAAGYALVQAAQARAASPGGPVQKYIAAAMTAQVAEGVPVSINRVSVVGANAGVTVYLADPGGPSAGNATTPGTEVYAANVAIQTACAQPGLTITVQAASLLTVALGTVTIYIDAAANVTAASATVTATAALSLFQTLLPIGGRQKVAGGQGYVLVDEVISTVMSRVNPSYPPPWVASTFYSAGDEVSILGQTFVATSPGTSASPPTGDGGPDGETGLAWAPTSKTNGASQFQRAPGAFNASVSGLAADVPVAGGQVVGFTYTIAVLIVPQAS